MPAGALFVPIAQAKLAAADDAARAARSRLAGRAGVFNAAFERKEYMEAYVAEEVAEEMLKNDPALQQEFEQRLRRSEFARSPNARLDFFYRRHSSWDERYNLYPVYRVARRCRVPGSWKDSGS